MEGSSRKERVADGSVVEGLREGIAGSTTIKLNNKEAFFAKLFEFKVNNWLTTFKRKMFYSISYGGLNMYLQNISPILVLCAGAILSTKGIVSITTVIAFFSYVGRIYGPIGTLSSLFVSLPGAYPAAERIFDILDHQEEPRRKGILPQNEQKRITLKEISFSYGRESVLKNVNLTINDGERIAIVGATGTGKTTLLLLFTGLYEPTEGFIFLNGRPLTEYDSQGLRNFIVYLSINPFIFNGSIRDNIILGSDCVESEIMEIVKLCQIDFAEDLNTNALGLSDGQKQRIALAREIIREPGIVLMDEATAAIDSHTEELIFKNIKEKFDRNITLIIVSHRFSTISTADQIVVMKEGSIIDSGSHEALFKRCDYYRELFEKQVIR